MIVKAYWNAVVVLCADTLGLCLALGKLVLVLELGTHIDGGFMWCRCVVCRVLRGQC